MNKLSAILVAAFVGTIVIANVLVSHIGPVPVGFGLLAPAGVFMAGFAFILRDLLQEQAKRPALWVLGAIAAGAVVSFGLGQGRIALAGAAAFAASELLDYLVFSSLRKAGFAVSAIASNIVGAVVDSYVFLTIAFGSLMFLSGQVVGKLWITAVFVAAYGGIQYVAAKRRSC